MYNDITGIILAGGKSSRMGVNKALLKFGDKTIIEKILKELSFLFAKIILITNSEKEYNFLNLETFKDIYPGMGPLSGIHSGLVNSNTEKNFIISCDIPMIEKEMIEYMINYKTLKPITVIFADGFIQQLCGMYKKSLSKEAEILLKQNSLNQESKEKTKCKVLSLIDRVGAEILESPLIPYYKDDMFLNVNKADDYLRLLKISKDI